MSLKIEVKPMEGTDYLETVIESGDPLADIAAELGLAVRRLHAGICDTHPIAGFQFMRALQKMFADPDFWQYEPEGETVEFDASITAMPKRKK